MFNSSIARRGVPFPGRNPQYANQLGFDADLIGADGILPNGATSATLAESTTSEQYLTHVVTLATELYPTADLDVTTGVSPKKPREGEPAAFKTVIRNDGPDAAPAVVVTDRVAGPAEILSARPSQGACVVDDHTVRCRAGDDFSGGYGHRACARACGWAGHAGEPGGRDLGRD